MKKFKAVIASIVFVLTLVLFVQSNSAAFALSPNSVNKASSVTIFAKTATGSITDGTDCSGSNYSASTAVQNNIIVCKYLKPATIFLSAGVGVIVIAMIIIGAIQYITSDGNPQAVSGAKKKIINAIIALVAYALMYSLLNFIIPGGIIPL